MTKAEGTHRAPSGTPDQDEWDQSGRPAVLTPMSDMVGAPNLELIVKLQIKKLPKGVYLAMSDDIQGLVAQRRTIDQAISIARDLARHLIEAQKD